MSASRMSVLTTTAPVCAERCARAAIFPRGGTSIEMSSFRSEPARLIIDRDERVTNVGVDDDRAGLRGEMRARCDISARRHVDRNVVVLVAGLLHDQRVATRLYLQSARNRSDDRTVFGVELHRRALFTVDAHGA